MDKTEGHVDMLRGVVEALRKDFNRKVAAGLVRDPQKLKGLAAKIFEIADETIYLAEEVQRVAGVYDDSEQPVAPQPDMLTESGEPIVLSKDARELLHILSAHDGKPMSPSELLSAGFKSDSKEQTRQAAVSVAAKILSQMLTDQAGVSALGVTGKTNARRYFLQSNALMPDSQMKSVTDMAPKAVASAPEQQKVSELPTNLEDKLKAGIQSILAKNTKPVITTSAIIHEAFGVKFDTNSYARVTRALKTFPELSSTGQSEYVINGRDASGDWIDSEQMGQVAQAAIDTMKKDGRTTLLIREVVAQQAKSKDPVFFTDAERKALKAAFAARGYVSGDVFNLSYEQ